MAQHDMIIDNAPGLTWRLDINAALAALVGNSAGDIEPPSPKAGMLWLDTSVPNGALKLRNSANASWIPLRFFEPPTVEVAPIGTVMTFTDAVLNATNNAQTIFPIGTTVVAINATANSRTAVLVVRLHSTTTNYEVTTGTGTPLAGTWRHRALINVATGNYPTAMQRTG